MKRIGIIFLWGTLLFGPGAAEPLRAQVGREFAERLALKSAEINTIVCDFVQTRQVAVLAEPVVRKGRFFYKREGNICLRYDTPVGDMIVMSDGRFKMVVGGKKTVVGMNSNPMLRQMNGMFAACMTGDVRLLEAGAKTTCSQSGSEYTVEIVPSRGQSRGAVSRITLSFDWNDMTLNRMRMDEPGGDYTLYEFSGKRFNEVVDDDCFETEK